MATKKTVNAADAAMDAATATAVKENAKSGNAPLFHINNFAQTKSGNGYKIRCSAYLEDGWHNFDIYVKDKECYDEEDLKKKAPFGILAQAKSGANVLKIIVPKEYIYQAQEEEADKPRKVEMPADGIPF